MVKGVRGEGLGMSNNFARGPLETTHGDSEKGCGKGCFRGCVQGRSPLMRRSPLWFNRNKAGHKQKDPNGVSRSLFGNTMIHDLYRVCQLLKR